ncbi:hypothetical protein TRFO_21312 [Tritrichomonas foetus]|uniref:Uncharacterized protein n=1 Tax=Tritrichomonas foetus TaxID=1144522 RepID=A0A1J4KK17_9EUKA|nr:hypothetical protein TRFO_21312 [Tritrichomonas foetus]|eukprot:OHT09693.1 hypothetical protein TRFO_21312 [Tritrichomonas foetus]
MESRLESRNEKIEKLEKIIEKLKSQKSVGNEGIKNTDLVIANLQKDKIQMESLSVKHRQDILSYIADNKKLADTNKRLETHIRDVDSALATMLERNKELARSLQESELRNESLLTELDEEKKNVYRLEYELSKLRDDERRGKRNLDASRLDSDETNAQQLNLLIANNTIKELKARIVKLEIEEQRAAKLQIELAKQKKVNEMLENQNDQLEMELESHRGSVEEYRKQIDDLRERNQLLEEEYEDRVNTMKIEVDFYRKRTEKEFKINSDLDEKLSEKDKEIDDLKEEIAQYLSGTYGLTQAVNEMRQLKAMVSVRDAQIADMVIENEWYQKVITALEGKMPSGFNFEQFFENLQKGEIEIIQKRAEKQALEMLKKTLEENKGTRVGEVKIIIGAETRHKKTLIVANNADGDVKIMSNAPSPLRDTMESRHSVSNSTYKRRSSSTTPSDYGEDDISNSDSDPESLFASSQISIMMKRKQRKDKERKMKEEFLDHTLQSIPHVVASNKVDTADISCQTEATSASDPSDPEPEPEPDSSSSKTEKKKVRKLRNDYNKAKKEKTSLSNQVKAIKEDFNRKSDECAEKSKEINGLKSRVHDLLVEIDKLKGELKQAKSEKPQILKPMIPPLSMKKSKHKIDSDSDSISSSESSSRQKSHTKNKFEEKKNIQHENKKVQVVAPGVTVSICPRPVYFEVRHGPILSRVHNDIFQIPTPETLEMIDSRIKLLQGDVIEAERKTSILAQEIEEGKHKLRQKDEIVDQMQKTIENLETRLNEQRAAFQEKITEMNNDAERILEARLKEARDMDAINNTPFARGQSETDLAEVSMRMAQLNRDKAKLLDELNDIKEAMRFMQRQNEQLKGRVHQLESDNMEMAERQMGSARQQALKDYSAGLKMKYTALQKKYSDLKRENEDLKKTKSRTDPLAMSSVSRSSERSVDDASDAGGSGRDGAKLKSAMLKIEQMKTQNEEMQLRLSKAQTTIERLNQLLQRKEQQLTKLQEQASQYKHQLARSRK